MAFSPYATPYPYPYQQYPQMPAAQDQLAQLRQTQQQTNPGIIWVQGEAGARGYLVGAGNSVMLMDSDANVFYIKSTDAAGIPQPLRVFDYKERTHSVVQSAAADVVTRKEFEELKARFDELTAKKEEPVHESPVPAAKRRTPADE